MTGSQKHTSSKHQTSGGMTGRLGVCDVLRQMSHAICAFCEKAAQPAQSSVQVELLIAMDRKDTPELG